MNENTTKIVIINSSSRWMSSQQLKVDTKESESFGYFLSDLFFLFIFTVTVSRRAFTNKNFLRIETLE